MQPSPFASLLVESPIGPLLLGAVQEGAYTCSFDPPASAMPGLGLPDAQAHVEMMAVQLREYFAAERTEFTLTLSPIGTEFQHRVWAALERIPYGQTISYGQLAKRLGDANASRAVGMANGRNPLAIIVPCHRVLNAAGGLHGYAGELWRKDWLLNHERGLFARTGRALSHALPAAAEW